LQRCHARNAKSRSCGTIKGTPTGGLSSAGTSLLHNDDSTVDISNLSKTIKSRRVVASMTATFSDDNPANLVQDLSTAPAHQDEEDRDIYEEGRDDIGIMSSITIITTH